MTINATYTTTTPAFTLLTTPDSGTALPSTDPSQYGNRPLAVYLQATTQNIRFTTDGSTPTSSHGTLLVADAVPFYYTGPLTELKFIQAASGAVLNVIYSQNPVQQGPDGSTGAQGATGPSGGVDIPDYLTSTIGYVLKIGGGRPTWADIVALRPELLAIGWTALHNYQTAQGQSDVVQLLKPAGSANLFIAEVTGNTGASEPDWSTAPVIGNTVVDGSVTWHNAMPYASFPPTPTDWAADTEFALASMVWPTFPNGRVYIAFPPVLTSGSDEPTSWAVAASSYVADGSGYWMNLGLVSGMDNILVWAPDLTPG